VGISTCLLGENVRYNGGHSRDRFLTDTFGRFVDWVPVCPEVECGLPVPRESMHLEGDRAAPRLVTSRTHVDHTNRMLRWARGRLRALEGEELVGFIFKANSPSSGMARVKVFDEDGMPHKVGVGIWARVFMDHFPLLPVEEEGRLHDDLIRENFIEQIFCLRRYRDAVRGRRSRGALVDFHASHKLQLMAHSPKHLREMGRLVARAKELGASELYTRYEELLMTALALKATPGKNANVLQHGLGYFKMKLTPDERVEMLEIIERHREGYLPLVVPVTLLSHYVRKYREPYLERQSFLNPHPLELKLRNHA
jgi:uncharacterized protein YbgA (DUF1722 family)/uncharacterized protein YbbK (DUF523 family)